MKSTNWKHIAELVGIAAIVASLVFVGLQMRQSREIALSQSYQSRADMSVDMFMSIYGSPELLPA